MLFRSSKRDTCGYWSHHALLSVIMWWGCLLHADGLPDMLPQGRMPWMHTGNTMHTTDMRDIVTSAAVLRPLTRLEERDGATLRCDASAPKQRQN